MSEPAFHIDLPAYEGPLEVLLELAKSQKVDLAAISILALVDQYLSFVRLAKEHKLELAADYLVMAAALAYLKSRLLLPPIETVEDAVDPTQAAEALAWRLKRLDAMKTAGAHLQDRPKLGLERFASALAPVANVTTRLRYTATLFDFLRAYARFKTRSEQTVLRVEKPRVFRFEEALERVQKLLNFAVPRWESLQSFLPDMGAGEAAEAGAGGQADARAQRSMMRRSALASTLLAGLELTKQGKLELRQDSAFAPLYLRAVVPK